MAPTPENPQSWQVRYRPREICSPCQKSPKQVGSQYVCFYIADDPTQALRASQDRDRKAVFHHASLQEGRFTRRLCVSDAFYGLLRPNAGILGALWGLLLIQSRHEKLARKLVGCQFGMLGIRAIILGNAVVLFTDATL